MDARRATVLWGTAFDCGRHDKGGREGRNRGAPGSAHSWLNYKAALPAMERPMPDQSISSPSLAIVCRR
jgi:hypothetical protein